jgi:hypothetical protein
MDIGNPTIQQPAGNISPNRGQQEINLILHKSGSSIAKNRRRSSILALGDGRRVDDSSAPALEGDWNQGSLNACIFGSYELL